MKGGCHAGQKHIRQIEDPWGCRSEEYNDVFSHNPLACGLYAIARWSCTSSLPATAVHNSEVNWGPCLKSDQKVGQNGGDITKEHVHTSLRCHILQLEAGCSCPQCLDLHAFELVHNSSIGNTRVRCIDLCPGKTVGQWVVLVNHMPNVCGELLHSREALLLLRQPGLHSLGHGKGQRLVVHEGGEPLVRT